MIKLVTETRSETASREIATAHCHNPWSYLRRRPSATRHSALRWACAAQIGAPEGASLFHHPAHLLHHVHHAHALIHVRLHLGQRFLRILECATHLRGIARCAGVIHLLRHVVHLLARSAALLAALFHHVVHRRR